MYGKHVRLRYVVTKCMMRVCSSYSHLTFWEFVLCILLTRTFKHLKYIFFFTVVVV
jgi:hypothetical protein